MAGLLGSNGEQVMAFIERMADFPMSEHAAVANQADADAIQIVLNRPLNAAVAAYTYSQARVLGQDLLRTLPPTDDDVARLDRIRFSSLLNFTLRAFVVRPDISDDVIERVVTPMCTPLDFEWRSWGVSTTT